MYMEDLNEYNNTAKEWTEKYAKKDCYTDNERLLSNLSEQYDLAKVIETVLRNNWNEKQIYEKLQNKQ